MARPQAFERELRLVTADLEPQSIARLLAQTARKALAEVQAEGIFPERYERAVNGRIGASEDSVQPPGPITYTANWLPEVAAYALAFAMERSPVRSGRFKKSWFVMVDGRETRDLESIPDEAECIITNDQPYARKIEVGAMQMRVPPGVAQDTRQAVLRRFGNIVTAQVRFIPLAVGYALRRGSQRKGRADRDRSAGRQLLYPAVVIAHRF